MRPTGIIRTLPSLGPGNVGRQRFDRTMALLEAGHELQVPIALETIPKKEILHLYLLIEGEIKVRLNIGWYERGDARECWDKKIRQPKFWAICTGPISRPEAPIKRRGFQGFRYTEDLW